MREYRMHGPPGCGKTTRLATRWVPEALEKHGDDSVMVCSLTKTAAREVASRNTGLKPERIGTLHGHAYRALSQPNLVEDSIGDWNAAHPHWAIRGDRDMPDDPLAAQGTGDQRMQEMEVLRHRMVDRAAWPVHTLEFARHWEAWKQEEDLVDFTDLIEMAMEESEVAPGDPRVLIVDEAQDCSMLELGLVRRWGRHADYLVLAGDGDQALYGWRGATAKAFLTPDIPDEHNYPLTQSYRVPRAPHAVARRWISQASHRYAVEYQPRDFEGSIGAGLGSGNVPEPLIDQIEEGLARDPEATSMLIAPCAFQLRKLVSALRRRGVPFHNPYRTTNGAWNPLRGGVARLAEFLVPDPRRSGDDYRLWNLRELWRWVECIKATGLPPRAKERIRVLVRQQRARDVVPPITSQEGRDLLGDEVWGELMVAFSKRTPDPVEWLEERLLASWKTRFAYAFEMTRSRGIHALSIQPRLTVGTVHSVKGGEADTVHILPDLSPKQYTDYTRMGEPQDSILRLFYVALTRARQHVLVHGASTPFRVQFPM